MFSHVMIGSNDIEESKKFYDKLFETLDVKPGKLFPNLTGQKRYFYNLKKFLIFVNKLSLENEINEHLSILILRLS